MFRILNEVSIDLFESYFKRSSGFYQLKIYIYNKSAARGFPFISYSASFCRAGPIRVLRHRWFFRFLALLSFKVLMPLVAADPFFPFGRERPPSYDWRHSLEESIRYVAEEVIAIG